MLLRYILPLILLGTSLVAADTKLLAVQKVEQGSFTYDEQEATFELRGIHDTLLFTRSPDELVGTVSPSCFYHWWFDNCGSKCRHNAALFLDQDDRLWVFNVRSGHYDSKTDTLTLRVVPNSSRLPPSHFNRASFYIDSFDGGGL